MNAIIACRPPSEAIIAITEGLMSEPPPKQEPIAAEEPIPLDGWPIWTAVRKLLPAFQERWLAVALLVAEGNQDEAEVKRLQTLLWPFLVKRIVKREITATGFRSDPENRIIIKPTLLQDAIPDWRNNTLLMGDIIFHGVRFAPAPLSAELTPPAPAATYRTGTPGRPSSVHLVVAEMRARAQRGELARGVAEEARHLVAWLIRHHPEAAQPKAKSLEDSIRDEYRRLKPPANNSGKLST